MSNMETKLVVDSGHPAVHIEVLDSGYRVRAKGYGRIEKVLPTGLYTVRYAAGDAREECDITLRPGEALTLNEPRSLPFASAAPLDLTWTSHEYHQANAYRLSRAPALERGRGAELFVFVRDLDAGGPEHPASGLSLHRLGGEMVLRFEDVVEASSERGEARWAGRNISVDPGAYRLRLELDQGKTIEMAVVACPGWQSQIFLLRQGGGCEEVGRTILDLPGATQLMAPAGTGFEPSSRVRQSVMAPEAGEDLRLAELARQALASGRRAIRTGDLSAMLEGKWQDPLLGVFGVHLLLMRPEPDLTLAERVVKRLREEILSGFLHPDVEALAAEITRRQGSPIDSRPSEGPPMLRASWRMLVRATADQPALIPPGSLTDRIADRLWGAGAWLIWETPPEAPAQLAGDDWLVRLIEGDRSEAPRQRIENLSDRVIIGGVTLFKSGVPKRAEEAEKEEEEGGAETLDDVKREPRSGIRSGEEIPKGGRDVLQSILDSPEIRSTVRSLVGRADSARDELANLSFNAVRTAVEALLPEIERLLGRVGMDELAQEAQLDTAEFAILVQLETLLDEGRRATPARHSDPLAIRTLVEQLGLPADRVQRAMTGLFLKLLEVLGSR